MSWSSRLYVGLGLAITVCGTPVNAAVDATGDIGVHRTFFYGPVINKKPAAVSSSKSPQKCRTNTQVASLLKKYDHAIKRYLRSKTRSILQKNTPRIKEGMTLSNYFADYRDYTIFIRTQELRDFPVKNLNVRKKFYIWKEDDKIIMGSDVMLMSQKTQNEVVERVIGKARRKWAADEYHRVAEKTKRVANATSFKLDCQHTADLNGLVKKAITDLMAKDDHRVISPRTFDKLLTILRAYITFNYYKDLSRDEFDQRFKELGRKEGRGRWTHQKLTRLLGLHEMGRIESNRAFRKTYEEAITRAAKGTPRIPRKWIEEIIWIETKGDPMTISRAGAYGLMQLMPLVYIGMGPEKARTIPLSFEQTINPFNAENNIARGAVFLGMLQNMLKPHMRGYARSTQKKIIFHAYNGGVTRVIRLLKKHGLGYRAHLPGETKAYMDKLADFPQH